MKEHAGGLIELDPATNPIVLEFMNLFVQDVAIRLDLEQFFQEAVAIDPMVTAEQLEQLQAFATIYKDPKFASLQKLIRYSANTAVLQMLNVWRELKGQVNE